MRRRPTRNSGSASPSRSPTPRRGRSPTPTRRGRSPSVPRLAAVSNSDDDTVPNNRSPRTGTPKGSPKTSSAVDVPPAPPAQKKWIVRTYTTLAMIFGYFGFLHLARAGGHVFLILGVQLFVYMELITIASKASKERDLPGFGFLYWLWFVVGVLFFWGSALKDVLLAHHYPAALEWFIKHSHMIAYLTWTIIGLPLFVLSLRRKKLYAYQFSQFGFAHVAILIVVGQSSLLARNVFSGFVWFVVPCGAVVCNDCFAYICGMLFGRTPLIRLSPKKTWEGFLGAAFFTTLWAFWFTRLLQTEAVADFYACPHSSFAWATEYCGSLEQDLFKLRPLGWYLGSTAASFLPEMLNVGTSKLMLHAVSMSLFSSLIAPFGGFFASGFKRAFKIKDFGDSIPGHGGVTDRMDCQIVMGSFAFIYYSYFVAASDPASSLYSKFCQLSLEHQAEFQKLLETAGCNIAA